MTNDSYFLKRITQTEFRGNTVDENDGRRSQNPMINLSLEEVDAPEVTKSLLRTKIKDEADFLVDTLLPEILGKETKKSNYLNKIYTRLGL